MKKLSTFLLVGTLALSVLSGCEKKDNENTAAKTELPQASEITTVAPTEVPTEETTVTPTTVPTTTPTTTPTTKPIETTKPNDEVVTTKPIETDKEKPAEKPKPTEPEKPKAPADYSKTAIYDYFDERVQEFIKVDGVTYPTVDYSKVPVVDIDSMITPDKFGPNCSGLSKSSLSSIS